MGAPMARNIARAGFDLTVFDLREEALASLEAVGARRAGSVAALAASVDVVGTCVLYDAQVREIFLADDGIIANARPGLVALIHSTVYPSTVVEIANAAYATRVCWSSMRQSAAVVIVREMAPCR